MSKIVAQPGQRIKLTYESRDFEVIVIDPNGLGQGQPTVGLGFRMIEKYVGIHNSTLSGWVLEQNGAHSLKLPSGKTFNVLEIFSPADGNTYMVLEASDWVALVADVIKHPGRISKATIAKVVDFLTWFAIKGFYADVYAAVKGGYLPKDSRNLTRWLESRRRGIPIRNDYTDLLDSLGCKPIEFARWTDYVYLGLFGVKAAKMREIWERQAGDRRIARNYIPESEGLEAVRFCEDMVVRIYVDNLQESHDHAILWTRRKFAKLLAEYEAVES
ncbi:MAG: hypothetical protein KME26_22810 [Oscillatoria princeps RMCB-10]|jgi:hypothetical protein|nr:hypothetical protein [Oscillatoria princeps RMCB-10]